MEGKTEKHGIMAKGMLYKDGKVFFTKKTEQKIFFILTIIMLLLGILSKLGLF